MNDSDEGSFVVIDEPEPGNPGTAGLGVRYRPRNRPGERVTVEELWPGGVAEPVYVREEDVPQLIHELMGIGLEVMDRDEEVRADGGEIDNAHARRVAAQLRAAETDPDAGGCVTEPSELEQRMDYWAAQAKALFGEFDVAVRRRPQAEEVHVSLSNWGRIERGVRSGGLERAGVEIDRVRSNVTIVLDATADPLAEPFDETAEHPAEVRRGSA